MSDRNIELTNKMLFRTKDDPDRFPLVFVPALFGSDLVQDEEKVFVTPSIGLKLSTPDLKLPLKWTDSTDPDKPYPVQARDSIEPGDVLKKVELKACCKTITLIDQYSKFCDYFQEKSKFHTFSYDWRRDLNETTDKLIEFLKEIKAKYGEPAQVVSHSMGCLIALAAYNTHPQLFHSSLFCGGMFAGGFGFYPTNTDGFPIGLNKTFLGPNVVHTFPSMYSCASPMGVQNDPILRCRDGRKLWNFVDLETGKDIYIDMWKIEDWKKFQLGPWRSRGKPVSKEMEEHVKKCLEVGYAFQLRMRNLEVKDGKYVHKAPMHDLETYQQVPVAVLVGDQFEHPDDFLWDSKKNKMVEWTPKLEDELEPMFYSKTDGTVSYISASQPPVPQGVEVEQYNALNNGPKLGNHRELMNDVIRIENILQELRENASMQKNESFRRLSRQISSSLRSIDFDC